VALCGELGANPMATMLLVGLGLDELSISPVALSQVKKIVRSMSYSDAKVIASRALTLNTAGELRELCREEMKARFADMPIWFNG
jgi:phosphotransferase system enzyme I (PtsI)